MADIEEIVRVTRLDVFNLNPFAGVTEILLVAVRLKKEGFFRESVLLLQVFFEVFLLEILQNILIEEGKSDTTVSGIMECGYKNILNEHLFQKLGINKNEAIVNSYWIDLYKLRNEVAHTGHNPNQ